MKKVLLLSLLMFAIFSIPFAHATTISLSLPSVNGSSNPCTSPTAQGCSPGNYIQTFYQFALALGGLLAFGAVVFGGVKYMTAAGNPSAQGEGKAWIESALLGLLLLAGAYLILNTVNPNLTHLDLTPLQTVTVQGQQGTPQSGSQGSQCGGVTCAAGQVCHTYTQNGQTQYQCISPGA